MARFDGNPFIFSSLMLLFLLSMRNLKVKADEIFTSTSGVTFGRSSREPKFKIEFHPVDSPFHHDNGQESVVMKNKEGNNYLCFLPVVEEIKTVKTISQQNSSNIILETDRRARLKTPDELIDVLDKCLYRHEGWWSYEFCNHKYVKQFHLEDEKRVQEFVLGIFDPDATAAFNENHSDDSMLKDPRSIDASQRYHAHQYTNGTMCDLTNQPRETEVRFVCSESPVLISSFKEISTCKYSLTVQLSTLCQHPLFQQERPMWHTIHCNEMPRDADTTIEEEHKEIEEKAMDWYSWLSKSKLEASLAYEYSMVFTHNELEEDDIPHFNHEFLQSMGISIAKHRLEILKLDKKMKRIMPKPVAKVLNAVKKTKKRLSEYLRPLVPCDSSAIVVVPESLNSQKRKKRLMLANTSVKITAPQLSLSHSSSPIMYSYLKKMKDDEGKELVRWDSMFENLKPT
ncbi:hypothetical protein J5N97_002674 [Dioscorea zingiberensis]|uniref:Protein OS-9 homolog n=1 Tax=Dioscorea zingiberensis TaxID=325984 RepID=A0A9D5HPP5_9LILI|nr:hypothetical protein J5N97_002674 [Dioscorea zingiberensis]